MHQYETDVLIGVDRVMAREHGCVSDVIKQESHLLGKSCLEPLATTTSATAVAATNGYSLSNGSRESWPSFRESFGFSAAQDAKMAANMAAASNGQLTQLSQLSPMDWPSMGPSRGQTTAGQYYSPPLAHAQATYAPPHPYGWSDPPHGHAQSAYAYGMTSPHAAYRQTDTSTTNYTYSSFASPPPSLPSGVSTKDSLSVAPSIQDMDAERTIRRARRNRTCFSKHQLESLEEVFKESRYPDVYRREEIAATLDLKEEVVRVWFKNRRAKLKRENKDGKVTSPGSPTSTTPSPKSTTTSPSYPSGTLYPSSTYPATPSFAPLPLKGDHVSTSPYFPSPYSGYAHSTVQADSLSGQQTPLPSKSHITSHVSEHGNPPEPMYGQRNDVTSSYHSVKCESSSEGRSFHSSPELSTTGAERTSTPTTRKTHTHSPSASDQ